MAQKDWLSGLSVAYGAVLNDYRHFDLLSGIEFADGKTGEANKSANDDIKNVFSVTYHPEFYILN